LRLFCDRFQLALQKLHRSCSASFRSSSATWKAT